MRIGRREEKSVKIPDITPADKSWKGKKEWFP
jgi:hypothetical protein